MKRVIYLYKSGTLQRQDASLILKQKNDKVDYILVEQVDTIICFGEVDLNKRTLSLLNSYQITILFFDYYGNYIGRFTPKHYFDGKLLVKQVEVFKNEDQRLLIAKSMINASFDNCLSLLKYYRKKGFDLTYFIANMELLEMQLKSIIDIGDILLLEAHFKKLYYSCFDIILSKEHYRFEKRTKHPPENELNALMSYGYALLYANYLSVLDRSRLHSQISFIHSLSKSSDSLQFDLADILKPVIVDRLILRLCRLHQLKDTYFEYKENRCYLNKEGVKFFVNEYETYMKRTVRINNRYYSYRNLISREVHLLSNYISGNSNEYKPFVMKW